MPWLCFAIVMSHMSWSHIRRQQADSPKAIDVTGAQMIFVIKLSSFCWNVADGMLPEGSLSDFQLERRIVVMPGLLDYLGYIFFFPSLMAGPAFDYAEYQRWLYPLQCNRPKKTAHAHISPYDASNVYAAARKAIVGIWWILLFVFLGGYFQPHILLQPSYGEMGFANKILCLYLVALTARLKYYGVWTLTEGSCIMAGLGCDGVNPSTGKITWNKLRNIDPLRVETAQNSRDYLSGWNINTNNWLRNYIYLRLTPRDHRPGYKATLATFLSSAVWHGFYPGYYLTFILGSLIQTSAKRMFNLAAFVNTPSVIRSPSNSLIYSGSQEDKAVDYQAQCAEQVNQKIL
jgi:lysophospholipid acyltransferase